MDANEVIKLLLSGAHLDRQSKPLSDLASVRGEDVEANDPQLPQV